MKLVILSEETDRSSDIVCSWLQRDHIPYLRLNSEKFANPNIEIKETPTETSVILSKNGFEIALSQTETVWFRRGYLYIWPSYYGNEISVEVSKVLNKHIENESSTLTHYLYAILSSKKKINHPVSYNYNKLIFLHEAATLGLKIPKTLVCGNGSIIRDFVKDNGTCITKSIQDVSSVNVDGIHSSIGKIAQVEAADITEDTCWYSLFQQEIPKKYELRVFFFLGRMYAMAIFSQMDDLSRLDFRDVDVNGHHPNRMVPFRLPKDVKKKIHKLMKRLVLESGSLDLIVTPSDEYYFLEVNPVGQFNFVSELCNYHIERDIAKNLAK